MTGPISPGIARGVAVAAAFVAAAAFAEAPALATYQGADRLQRITEAAQREGVVTIYTSTPVDDIKVLTDAFERKYGVKTNVWRASSEAVLQRGVAEARAGRIDVDVYDTNGPEMEALAREGILTPVWSRTLDQLVPEARWAHGLWVGTRLNVFAFAYNTSLVKKTDLPSSYAALVDPKWKGRLGIEADDADWFAAVSGLLGEDKASRLFREIAATNGVSVRKGHTLLANLVAAGEIPLALDVYNYKAQQLKDKGAPIDWFIIEPAIAQVNGVGVAARAAHPSAALLWYEFEIGEDGQRLLLSRSFVPTNRAVETPLNKFKLRLIDARAVQDERAKWESRYAEVLRAGAR